MISLNEFADAAAFPPMKPAANDNFVDLVSRDPACQIILVRCFVSFRFVFTIFKLFCSSLEQISVQSSLNLRFLIFSRPYRTVQIGFALNGRVRRSSVIMDEALYSDGRSNTSLHYNCS